jgi:hypothetical protein
LTFEGFIARFSMGFLMVPASLGVLSIMSWLGRLCPETNMCEGIGLFGRGWLEINTLKKHYLSLTERSERIQNLSKRVQAYSTRFNEKPIGAGHLCYETYCATANPAKKARS